MPKCVAIIQARLGSTRLPGKVLADVCGKPLLQRVVDRVRECDMVDEAVVACPLSDRGAIASALGYSVALELAGALGLPEARQDGPRVLGWAGDEADVLARYAQAANETHAGIIVRITGDCPLVDPAFVDSTVREWLAYGGYVATSSRLPRGIGGEVFGARALRHANAAATDPTDREHVTPWIKRHVRCAFPGKSHADGRGWYEKWRWCVDEQADLDFVRAVYEHLDDPLAGWREVLRVVEEHDLAKINAHVKQREV